MFNDKFTLAHYIIEKGVEIIKEFTQEDIDEMYNGLLEKEKDIKARGRVSILSPDYQKSLVQTAWEICKNDKYMDVIAYMMANSTYIDKYIDVEGN